MKLRAAVLLPVCLLAVSCGSKEKDEAVRFAKTLNGLGPAFKVVNAAENEFLDQARRFCADIVTNGAGKASEMEQKAEAALAIAKGAEAPTEKLSEFRRTVNDISLMQEFSGGIRGGIIDTIAKRQRFLHEVKTLFEQAAPQFRALGSSKTYEGDSYPDAISKLNSTLLSYRVSEGTLEEAVKQIKENYKLEDADLGG